MKVAVIYASVHHHNTEKLIQEAGKTVDLNIFTVEEAKKTDLSTYDMVGIASGLYFGKIHNSLLEYFQERPKLPKKAFGIITCGDGSSKHKKDMMELLENYGLEAVGAYICKGFDTYGPFKWIGGINKKHPNQKDIEGCITFINEVI